MLGCRLNNLQPMVMNHLPWDRFMVAIIGMAVWNFVGETMGPTPCEVTQTFHQVSNPLPAATITVVDNSEGAGATTRPLATITTSLTVATSVGVAPAQAGCKPR